MNGHGHGHGHGGGEESVLLTVTDGVALLTLNRPGRLNAIDDDMHHSMNEAFAAVHRDPAVRAVVVTGAGRAFCAGADMSRLDRLVLDKGRNYDIPRPGTPAPAFEGLDGPREAMTTYTFPLAMDKPVIAAVNGPAIGAGMVLACSCDMRFVGPDALFAAAFAQRGVVAEFGLSWLLPRIVGAGVASDMLLSGRRVDAAEALRIGLASRLANEEPVLEQAMAAARAIAQDCSPRSIRIVKQQLAAAPGQSYGEATQMAYDLLIEALASDDFAEGVLSFQEKRPPRFTGT